MKIKFVFALTLLIMCLSLPMITQAAKPLGPPIAELISERNRTAEGTIVKKLPGRKLEMQVGEYLSERDESRIMLKVDKSVFADVKVGKNYLFVFSRMRKNRLLRDQWEVNPDGPSLVEVRGVGTSAIYVSNPELRTLLTPPGKRDKILSADSETAMLISLAKPGDDTRARDLAVFELALRPDLQETISIDNAERFAALARSADIKSRTFLLRAALRFPEERRAGWLVREWRRAAMDAGTDLDLNSFEPLLVKISMQGLKDYGDAEDIDLISKHLYANNPGVAKAALEALDAIDSKVALARVQAVMIEEPDMHMSTRQAFTQYIKKHSGA